MEVGIRVEALTRLQPTLKQGRENAINGGLKPGMIPILSTLFFHILSLVV
jgi:hypothetical protein